MADAGEKPERETSVRSGVLQAVTMIIVGLVAPAVAIAVAYRSCDQANARGQIAVKDTPAGSWRQPLLTCWMPEAEVRDTVAVGRSTERPLAIISVDRAAHAPVVELTHPSEDKTFRIDTSMCAMRLRPRHGDLKDDVVDLRDASLFVDCKLPGGARIEIDAWWQRCKSP